MRIVTFNSVLGKSLAGFLERSIVNLRETQQKIEKNSKNVFPKCLQNCIALAFKWLLGALVFGRTVSGFHKKLDRKIDDSAKGINFGNFLL